MATINSYYCKVCKKHMQGEQQKDHHIYTNKHELKCLLEYNKKNCVFIDNFNKNKKSMDFYDYDNDNNLICRCCLIRVHPNQQLNHLKTVNHKISVCCASNMPTEDYLNVVHRFFIENI